MSDPRPPWRANYVPAPHFFNLNHACVVVNKALGDYGCFLVGSSIKRRDFRDVDVRFIMKDEKYDRMFRAGDDYVNPLWSLLCMSISLWLSEQSKLPIDFQIQRQSSANRIHSPPEHERQALGIFIDYPGERPSETTDQVPVPSPGPSLAEPRCDLPFSDHGRGCNCGAPPGPAPEPAIPRALAAASAPTTGHVWTGTIQPTAEAIAAARQRPASEPTPKPEPDLERLKRVEGIAGRALWAIMTYAGPDPLMAMALAKRALEDAWGPEALKGPR